MKLDTHVWHPGYALQQDEHGIVGVDAFGKGLHRACGLTKHITSRNTSPCSRSMASSRLCYPTVPVRKN